MKEQEKYFAKPLDKWDRFYTTIKIIAGYFPQLRPFTVLYYLMATSDRVSYNNVKKEALTVLKVGINTREQIKTLFLKIYNDEDLILDYLNKKITRRYFLKNKEMKTTPSAEADKEVSAIMDDLGLFNVLKDNG